MQSKLLGHSGLRVSELCLGTMTFGKEWGWGSDYDESKEVFEAFCEAGGYFLDTANRYTEGTSEKWLGDFIHSNRDHFVLATKFALKDKNGDLNFAGNHRKNMMRSVEGSLKRLNTSYIDLLWVHAWDFTTSPQELMRGLDDLVRSGKVHYIGISDTPAWIVSTCNVMAELRGWERFAALQIEYNLLQRTPERDLLPMAKAFDLAITPWAPLAGGALTGKYLKNEGGRVKEDSVRRGDKANKIAQMVVDIASNLGFSPAQVALAWLRSKSNQIIPIVGARKASQLIDSLKCIDLSLSMDNLNALDEISAEPFGFPHEFLKSDGVKDVCFAGERDKLDIHR